LVVKDSMEVLGFNRWVLENFLQFAPGATIENDLRQSAGKEYFEYWAALIPQREINHQVRLLWQDNKTIDIPPSPSMIEYPVRQWSYETKDPIPLSNSAQPLEAQLAGGSSVAQETKLLMRMSGSSFDMMISGIGFVRS
jgi:hypothetical protein